MFVLITYDVNTQDAEGKNAFVMWQNNVSIMESVSRILYLNAWLTPLKYWN